MSPALLGGPDRDRLGGNRRGTVRAGTRAEHESRGTQQLTLAVMSRLPLVVGAMVLGALLIVLASIAPGRLRGPSGAWALHRASRLLLRALGVRRAQRTGPRSGASLVVANDMSWLDVLVLSAAAPVLPVANAEVAGWPLIGSLARRSGTIFINPRQLSGLPGDVERIATAMRRGHRVMVFPTVGSRSASAVSQFRTAPFQSAVDAAVVVSPVVVTYRGSSGCLVTPGPPVDRAALVDSLIGILAHRRTADVNWLPVIPAIVDGGHPAGDRARAAAATQRALARASQQRPTGHIPAPNSTGRPHRAQPLGVVDKPTEVAPAA